MLTAGKGIPISLAIVHAAVGRRAGLDISCVNMPRHFINRYGSFGDAEERFIDAFDGGKLLTRSGLLLFIEVAESFCDAQENFLIVLHKVGLHARQASKFVHAWYDSLLLIVGKMPFK